MLSCLAFLQNFLTGRVRRDDRGVTSVEYALLIALIVVVLIGAVTAFSGVLDGVFNGFKF
jgi:pilus assembly protein Flp/PilA